MSLEERARILEALQKLGVGLVAILVLGGIFGSYLWSQVEISRENLLQRHQESERLFALMDSVRIMTDARAERFSEAMEAQTQLLNELTVTNRANLRLIETNTDLIREIRQDAGELSKTIVRAIQRTNVEFLKTMKESFRLAKDKEVERTRR